MPEHIGTLAEGAAFLLSDRPRGRARRFSARMVIPRWCSRRPTPLWKRFQQQR